jgi:hypothetical protein
MDIDKYSPVDIKKLFTKNTTINFLNDYTFQDVEDAKKKIYMKMNKEYSSDELKSFLDAAGKILMEDKISNGFDKPIGAVIKNTVKDNLNPDYKNTIKRLINIDSQYIPLNTNTSSSSTSSTNSNSTNYVFKLTEKLVNVVSLELINLQIPMSFYNIEDRQGNNLFYLKHVTSEDVINPIIIEDGYYDMPTLISSINTSIHLIDPSLNFTINPINGKTIIINTSLINYTLEFYENTMNDTKINNCLGWILGFHNYTDTDIPYLLYTINSTETLTSDKVAYINNTKNFIVVVDEFSQNHTSGTIVQTINDVNSIKPSSYTYNSKTSKNSNYVPYNLECLTPTNIVEPTSTIINGTNGLTKAQLFSRAQINHNKILVNQQNNYLEPNTQNNVLAIVPFETLQMKWGYKYFTDKNEYIREYHGPIEIEKIQIRIYDDKGYEMNFNGANWSMTIITEHLYKY